MSTQIKFREVVTPIKNLGRNIFWFLKRDTLHNTDISTLIKSHLKEIEKSARKLKGKNIQKNLEKIKYEVLKLKEITENLNKEPIQRLETTDYSLLTLRESIENLDGELALLHSSRKDCLKFTNIALKVIKNRLLPIQHKIENSSEPNDKKIKELIINISEEFNVCIRNINSSLTLNIALTTVRLQVADVKRYLSNPYSIYRADRCFSAFSAFDALGDIQKKCIEAKLSGEVEEWKEARRLLIKKLTELAVIRGYTKYTYWGDNPEGPSGVAYALLSFIQKGYLKEEPNLQAEVINMLLGAKKGSHEWADIVIKANELNLPKDTVKDIINFIEEKNIFDGLAKLIIEIKENGLKIDLEGEVMSRFLDIYEDPSTWRAISRLYRGSGKGINLCHKAYKLIKQSP